MKMPRVGLLTLIGLAFYSLAFPGCVSGQGISCSSYSEQSCYLQGSCNWNNQSASCVSVLPCALEILQSNCLANTWGCSWSANKCQKKTQNIGATHCSTIKNENNCKAARTCLWKNNQCALRPTIIFSVADDLSWYDVSWTNPRARTPVLNMLKNQGVTLDRHYAYRFCAPSRAMMFTGAHAWRLGLQTDLNLNPAESLRCGLPLDLNLFPSVLQESGGYTTHAVGKWHLGSFRDDYLPTSRGFNSFIGFFGGSVKSHQKPEQFIGDQCACKGGVLGRPKKCNQYEWKRNNVECVTAAVMVNYTSSGDFNLVLQENVTEDATDLFLAERAKELILKTPNDDPLFVYVGWAAAHTPVHAPDRYLQSLLNTVPVAGDDSNLNTLCSTDERMLSLAMVSVMDEAHRIIIDALETTGRYDSSIIIFLSDNGGNTPRWKKKKNGIMCYPGINYPLRGSKFTWFEGGIRTLAIISSPGLIQQSQRGTHFTSLFAINDWAKTILSASGIVSNKTSDDAMDQWQAISSGNVLVKRDEFPLQLWTEQNRAVILFYFEGALWKAIKGYPFSGVGPGARKKGQGYGHSDIFLPWELPRSEAPVPPSNGYQKKYNCEPFCIFNLDDDPSEFTELSKKRPQVMNYARSLVSKYNGQSVKVAASGLCEKNYYAQLVWDITDSYSIKYARACGSFLPWLYVNNTLKPLCTEPFAVIQQRPNHQGKGLKPSKQNTKKHKNKKKNG